MFYVSERIGRYGKIFKLIKFRTMRKEPGPKSTSADDPRITKVGKFLRKTKLDELPQIINILKGDMAIVGPRPTLGEVINTLNEETKKTILSVKPGIIGAGTLYDMNEEELLKGSPDPHKKFMEEIYPEIVKRELEYIRNKSIILDIKLIVAHLSHYLTQTLGGIIWKNTRRKQPKHAEPS